jgi:uncharacterized repeat protein (TIGR01451 family)/fimbrial isopeptide formation D2 family protein
MEKISACMIRIQHLILLCIVTLLALSSSPQSFAAGETAISLLRTYSGNIDYIATGASFRNQPNGVDSCSFVSPMSTSVVVNIPASATVIDAFLYFAGSGDDQAPIQNTSTQTAITLNGISIPSTPGLNGQNFEITDLAGTTVDFFAGRRDVNSIVTGPGVYTFAGLDVHTVLEGRTDNQTCLGAWSLIVVYEDPSVSVIRVINLFDGFDDFQNNLNGFDIEPRNFVLDSTPDGKATHITYEGDETLAAGAGTCTNCEEKFKFAVPSGTPPTDLTNLLNPPNNQFNGTVTGPDVLDIDNAYGLDLDTYDISTIIAAAGGEYTATANFSAAQDLVILQAEVIAVESKRLADIEIDLSAVGTFTENGSGQYKIIVKNNGDGTGLLSSGNATGFVEVFADLPNGITFASFSATGWTCSATASSNDRIRCYYDLSTLGGGLTGLDPEESLNDILINVNVGTPGASVDMSAWAFSCNVTTTFNLGAIATDGSMSDCDSFIEKHQPALSEFDNKSFFVEIAASIFTVTSKNSSNNNVDALTTSILAAAESDISTSTKTLTDLNGGSVEVGDTLEYTLTLTESAGNTVTGLSFTDVLDTDTSYAFGSLTVTGSSYTVVSTGTTVELSGLDISASSSITIKFRVDVKTGTQGQAISNSANLTNPNGPDITISTGTVFVSLGNIIGNKPLYLDSLSGLTGILTRTAPTVDDTTSILSDGQTAVFDMISVPSALVVNSGDIAISLWMRNEVGTGNKTIDISLEDELGTSLGSDSITFSMAASAEELVPFIINTSGFTLTNPANDFLRINITNNSGGGETFSIHSKLTSISSSIVIDSANVINVELINFKDATCTTTLVSDPMAGDTICIESIVSDPFGSYDIQPSGNPALVIQDPDSVFVNPNTLTNYAVEAGSPTTLTNNPDAERKTYQWTFTIPTTIVSLGTWDVSITANEGTEGSISDVLSSSFQTAIEPDTSTSTKSVVNLDSALNQPGDTLRYTVTITESAGGTASGVSLIDFIPPSTNNLVVVSIPAGATNSSTTTKVDISGITISPNSSVQVIFDVDIAGGTTPGTRIDNTANIDNPNGPENNPGSASIFVYAAPTAGAKILYPTTLDTAPQLSRAFPATNNIRLDAAGGSAQMSLTPSLTKNLTIEAGTVDLNLWLVRTSNDTAPTNRDVSVNITYSGTSNGSIGSDSQSLNLNHNTPYLLVPFSIPVASNVTLLAGTTIKLTVTNTTSALATRRIRLSTEDSGTYSTLSFVTPTVINVDSIQFFDAAYPDITMVTNPAAGDTIFIRATVSDPFGEADIQPIGSPAIIITDPDTTTQVSTTMGAAVVETVNDTSIKIYEFSYLIPAGPTTGNWTVNVEADEGEEGTISHTVVETFNTSTQSNLSTSIKSVVDLNGNEAEPGDILEYTITLTETGGANANSVSVSDTLDSLLTNFSVTNNGGGSDSSTAVTGPLNITNINVIANSSVNIVFEATVLASADPGDFIDNTAIISNPTGPGATTIAPTTIVSPSSIATTGNKFLYLDNLTNSTGDLTRSNPSSIANSTATLAGAGTGTVKMIITPAFQKDIELNAGEILASIWMERNASGNNQRQFQATLAYEGTISGTIDTVSRAIAIDSTVNPDPPTYILVPTFFTLGTNLTLPAGTSLYLSITNTTAQAARSITINSLNGSNSNISLPANTIIAIDSLELFDSSGAPTACAGGTTLSAIADDIGTPQIAIRMTVSDPFGEADITSGTVALTSLDGEELAATAMTSCSTSAGIRNYGYEFDLLDRTDGIWTVNVVTNEGFEATINDTSQATFTTDVTQPNLATSTKSVVDLLGGDAEPGDVLEYTITVIESAGTAVTGVSVNDVLPANITFVSNSISVTGSTTTASIDSSSPIVISNIGVAASGVVTITFQVTVNGGALPGDIINNSANVNNPLGTNGAPVAPSLIVSASSISTSGTKPLYFDNLNTTPELTRSPGGIAGTNPTTIADTTLNLIGLGGASSLALKQPSFSSATLPVELPITLTSGSVPISIWMACANSCGSAAERRRNIDINLAYSVSGGTATSIGTDSINNFAMPSGSALVKIPFTVDIATDLNLPADTALILTITNNSISTDKEIDVSAINAGENSKVNLNISTVVNVDSLSFYNNSIASNQASLITSINPEQTVYVRATISDPFGSFDISASTLLLEDVDGVIALNNQPMTEHIASATDSTKTFESSFLIPAAGGGIGVLGNIVGNWTANVTGNEGQEGDISHSIINQFNTDTTVPTVETSTKSYIDQNGGDVEPGDTISYTISIIESANTAVVVNLTDTLDPNLTFSSITNNGGGTTNSTNPIDISGISIPPSGTVDVVFEATVAGGLSPGTLINNSATIINLSGPGAAPSAPSIIVSQTSIAAAGSKPLYITGLGVASGNISRIRPVSDTTSPAIAGSGGSVCYDLSPQSLNRDLTLATGTINSVIWLLADASGSRTIALDLGYSASNCGGAITPIDTDSTTIYLDAGTGNQILTPFEFNIPPATVIPSGSAITLTITNNTATAGEQIFVFSKGSSTYSSVDLDSETVIAVESVSYHDAAHGGGSEAGSGNIVTSVSPGGQFWVRTKVSDPFGTFDINNPTVEISDPDTIELIATTMGAFVYEDLAQGFRIYEYNYTLPASPDLGFWSSEIIAIEGEEAQVQDSLQNTILVSAPVITLLHFSSEPNVDPGDSILYTVRVTHTSGPVATGLILNGLISEFVELFNDKYGVAVPFDIASPSFTPGTITFSDDDGGTFTHVPNSPYDGTATNYRVIVTEGLGPSDTFDMTYEVRVQ